jgi:hypothetical protein
MSTYHMPISAPARGSVAIAANESGAARPLILGYMLVRSMMSTGQEEILRQELIAYAAYHGFHLSRIYVERDDNPGLNPDPPTGIR